MSGVTISPGWADSAPRCLITVHIASIERKTGHNIPILKIEHQLKEHNDVISFPPENYTTTHRNIAS